MKTLLVAATLCAFSPLQVLAQAPEAAPQEKENALKYLAAASAAYKPYAYVKKEGTFEPPTGAAARRVVEENAAVFPLLEQAVAAPLNFDARTLNSDDAQNKILSNGRDVARLLALRCGVQTEAGDAAGASRSGLLCVALGLKFQEDGGLLSALTGGGIEQIGLGAMKRLAPKWDAATLGVAARELGKIEAKRPPYALTLASENKSQVNFWRQAFQRGALTVNGYDQDTQDRLLTALGQAFEQDDALFTHDFASTRGLDFHTADNQLAPPDKAPVVDADFDIQAWAESWPKPSLSSKHNTLFLRTRDQTQTALLQASLAARAYQIEHKAPPASLQILVPDYLPAVPADPFGINTLLQFKSGADGLKIYSVGPDGLDDDGQQIQNLDVKGRPTESKIVSMKSRGDMIAPPELLKL